MAEQMATLSAHVGVCRSCLCFPAKHKVKTAFDYDIILSQCISWHDSLFDLQPNLSKQLSWLLQETSRIDDGLFGWPVICL